MTSTLDLLRHPSELFAHRRHKSHGAEITGIVTLLFFVGIFIWLYPELHRYIRISRM